jgi:hypothetical protein
LKSGSLDHLVGLKIKLKGEGKNKEERIETLVKNPTEIHSPDHLVLRPLPPPAARHRVGMGLLNFILRGKT